MSKRMTVLMVAITLLAGAGIMMAQQGMRGGPRMGPPGGPMREWFDDLEKAYQQKDMDKVGALIEQMAEQRRQFQQQMRQGRPGGPPDGRRGPGGFGPQAGGQGVENRSPLAKTEFEKNVLAVLDDMDRNQRRGMMNVPQVDGRLLRLLVEATGAKRVVEIGTSNGYSGIWQSLALKSTGGKLTTFEIDEGRAALARQNFQKAGVDGIATLVLGDAHEKVADVEGPIDIIFLDADKDGYIDYLNKLLGRLRPGGLVVAHNINPGQADPRYLEAITTNPDLETLILNQGGGVSITLRKRRGR